MDTKEKILHSALELFARDGFEAVSVSMIADELGISKGALYKHYINKRAIFDSIVRRMDQQNYENARRFDLPGDLLEGMPERFKNTGLERLCAYAMAQFVFWTEDEFASRFRKLVSLERYRNGEMNALYQRYFGSGALEYAEKFFEALAGGRRGEPDPRTMALEFYAPVFALIDLFDGGGDPADPGGAPEGAHGVLRCRTGKAQRGAGASGAHGACLDGEPLFQEQQIRPGRLHVHDDGAQPPQAGGGIAGGQPHKGRTVRFATWAAAGA